MGQNISHMFKIDQKKSGHLRSARVINCSPDRSLLHVNLARDAFCLFLLGQR